VHFKRLHINASIINVGVTKDLELGAEEEEEEEEGAN
jgi:hypothetical protein